MGHFFYATKSITYAEIRRTSYNIMNLIKLLLQCSVSLDQRRQYIMLSETMG